MNDLPYPEFVLPMGHKRIAFDTEYDPSGTLLTVAVSDGTSAAAAEKDATDWTEIRRILEDSEYLVGHSVAGDLRYLADVGALRESWVTGEKCIDSLLLARMVDENRVKGGYELETLLQSIYKVQPWKAETKIYDKIKVGKSWRKNVDARRWPEELRRKRCALDAWGSYVLAEYFGQRLREKWPLVRFTHQIANVLDRISISGAVVDTDVFEKHEIELEQRLQRDGDLLTRAALAAGMASFSLTNDNDLRTLLFDKLGQKPQGKTKKTKVPSVDKASLLKLEHPIARQIVDYNTAHKLYSVNVKGLRAFLRPAGTVDGVAVCYVPFHINPLGARTGRRSSSKPNSQNWTPSIRSIIRSRFKGGKIGSFDYEKLEPRIIASQYAANDPGLMRVFTIGNGYVDIAQALFKKTVPKTGIEYRATKAIVLGVHYNKQTDSMAEDLWDGLLNEVGEITQIRFSADYDTHWKIVDRLRNGYLDEYSGLRTYMSLKERELLRTQSSISATGRVRHLPLPDGRDTVGYHHAVNMAINFPVQSLASDITGSALIDVEAALIHEAGMDYCQYYQGLLEEQRILLTTGQYRDIIGISRLINEVHDELTLDLHPGHLKRDIEIVIETMKSVPTLKTLLPGFGQDTCPLDIAPKIGNHWGDNDGME